MPESATPLLRYEMCSSLDQIEGLAHAVQTALVDHADWVFTVNFCIDELITNTITHGLEHADHGQIVVSIHATPNELQITIEDDAPAYDPFTNAPPPDLISDLHARPIGGLGVHLIKKLVSHYDHERQDAWNVTKLWINLDTDNRLPDS